MAESVVLYERVGKTAVITLNRPAQKNALDLSMRKALALAIDTARLDASVHSIVLTGAGQDFCAGADLKEAPPPDSESAFFARDTVLEHQRWFSELIDLEKPVISAVDGFAVGAGLSLALAADFVLVSERARLASIFPRVGLLPDLSLLYVLPRLVGLARAKEIVFSARDIGADEALAMGMVHSIVPAQRLKEAALAFAQRFDDAPTRVLGMAKGILNRSFETSREAVTQLEATAQGLFAMSRFSAEAMKRFLTKEAPLFNGAAPFDSNTF